MKRRNLLKAAAVGSLATAIASPAIAQSAPEISYSNTSNKDTHDSLHVKAVPGGESPDETAAEFKRYLEKHGFAAGKSAPLVTGDQFNGGLQYTGAGISDHPETDPSAPRPAQYVVQQVARVEDIAKKASSGTLPIFAMIGPEIISEVSAASSLELILKFLTVEIGLDAARLRVTGTDRAEHFFPIFAKYGVGHSQIRLRSWEEAKQDGGGSGYFAPKGHPRGPAYDSFSIECILSDGTDLEIAEFLFGGGKRVTVGVIGVERVTMARNDRVMSWDAELPAFKKAVEEDAQRNHLPLPSGYYAILGLPPAG